MLEGLTSAEVTELLAYWEAEPFGAVLEDLLSARVTATIANVHRGRGAKPSKSTDFMLFVERPRPDAKTLDARIESFFRGVKKRHAGT